MKINYKELSKQILSEIKENVSNSKYNGCFDFNNLVVDFKAELEINEINGYASENFGLGIEYFEVGGEFDIQNIELKQIVVTDDDDSKVLKENELDAINHIINRCD